MPYKDPEKKKASDIAYRAANRDRVKAYLRDYDATRRDKVARNAKARATRLRDLQKKRDQERASRIRHRAAFLARCKAYRDANSEKVRATIRAWHRAHPEASKASYKRQRERNVLRFTERWARRRSLKLQTATDRIDFMQILRESKGLCGICRKPFDLFGIEFDHIIPLAKGGTHTRENIQAAHMRCNRAKGAKVG